jgi:hypothetical protein
MRDEEEDFILILMTWVETSKPLGGWRRTFYLIINDCSRKPPSQMLLFYIPGTANHQPTINRVTPLNCWNLSDSFRIRYSVCKQG